MNSRQPGLPNRRDLWLRLKAIFLRKRIERELQDELEFHIEMQTRKNLARGLPAEEAGRQARLEFGRVARVAEDCRDERRVTLIANLLQDIQYAVRGLRRSPGFAAVVVATIGVGLGINALVFTVFNAYALRPYPVRDPYSLYRFNWITSRSSQARWLSWDEYQAFPKASTVAETIADEPIGPFPMDGRAASGQLVTGNYFQMLGVNALLGRVLTPEDAARNGNSHVVVLSYTIWQSRYAGDSGIIGKEVTIRGQRLQVVGITGPAFLGVGERLFDFWAPITLAPEVALGADLFGPEHPQSLEVVGRLSPFASPAAVSAELTGWITDLTATMSERTRVRSVTLTSRATYVPIDGNLIVFVVPLFIAFVLVLLLACANVGNLMLARSVARQREIGIRLSLGAGRHRLVRQLLSESIVLAVPAGIVGFFVSRVALVFGIRLFFATAPSEYAAIIRFMPLDADGRVLLFMLLAGLFSALAFGLAPALHATRANIVQTARGDFSSEFRPGRLRNVLITVQTGISVLLLIAAGVLTRGAQAIQRIDPGMDPHNVLVLHTTAADHSATLSLLDSQPAVESVGGASHVPFRGPGLQTTVTSVDSRQVRTATLARVSPEFFPVMRMSVLRGRNFSVEETRGEADVAVVSKSLADAFSPFDPIGRSVRIPINATSPAERELKIVGIVPDPLSGWVAESTQNRRNIYLPLRRESAEGDFLVRVHGDAETVRRQLDNDLTRANPSGLVEIHKLQEVFEAQFYPFTVMY
jgi:predicted permease